MVVDLDCRVVVCRGMLGTRGDCSGPSLLTPLFGTGDNDVR
jgi:hypothetical protein